MPRARPRPLVLLAAALLAAAGASPARAEDPAPASPATDAARTDEPPGEPAPATPPPVPPAKSPGKAGSAEEDTWLDVGHSFVEQRIFAPVLRLDRFFSDERDIEAERSRSFLRWRNEVRIAEDRPRAAFTTGVRATLRLPGINKRLRRLRVVIAGETRDAVETLFPPDPAQAGEAATGDEVGTGDAGLAFYLWDSLLSHADLGGGVIARLPPGVYGRIRLRWAIPVRRLFLTRTALSGFWRTDTRFGSSTALELERPLYSVVVARLSGTGALTEVSRGVEWGTELALLAALGPRTGAQVAAAMTGASDASPGVDRYRVYTRLRRDVYRRWLFLELEPEVSWPWTPELGRRAAWGLAFRLEAQFHGNEAPPPPPPPKPPEPRDPPDPDAPPEGPLSG